MHIGEHEPQQGARRAPKERWIRRGLQNNVELDEYAICTFIQGLISLMQRMQGLTNIRSVVRDYFSSSSQEVRQLATAILEEYLSEIGELRTQALAVQNEEVAACPHLAIQFGENMFGLSILSLDERLNQYPEGTRVISPAGKLVPPLYCTVASGGEFMTRSLYIDEDHNELTLTELDEIFLGWQAASYDELDRMAEQTGSFYRQMSFGYFLDNYYKFASINFSIIGIERTALLHLSSARRRFPEKTTEQILEMNFWDLRVRLPEIEHCNLIEPLMRWLNVELARTISSENQSKLLYLLFQIENPLSDPSARAREVASKIYHDQLDRFNEQAVIIEDYEQSQAFHVVARFITESALSAYADFPNAWAYAKTASLVLFDLLNNDEFRFVLSRDLLLFAEKQTIVFPPQIYFIFNTLIDDYHLSYTNEESYRESLMRALSLFYNQHESLAQHEKYGSLNYSVSGGNRSRASLHNEHFDVSDGLMLSVFSGPLQPAVDMALWAEQVSGAQLPLITCDRRSAQELNKQGLLLREELLPIPQQQVSKDSAAELPVGAVHIQADLPTDFDQVRMYIEKTGVKVAVICDERGSLLYLEGLGLLNHLTNLVKLMPAHSYLVLSKGISRWMIVDLVLRKDEQHRLLVESCCPGLDSFSFRRPRIDRTTNLSEGRDKILDPRGVQSIATLDAQWQNTPRLSQIQSAQPRAISLLQGHGSFFYSINPARDQDTTLLLERFRNQLNLESSWLTVSDSIETILLKQFSSFRLQFNSFVLRAVLNCTNLIKFSLLDLEKDHNTFTTIGKAVYTLIFHFMNALYINDEAIRIALLADLETLHSLQPGNVADCDFRSQDSGVQKALQYIADSISDIDIYDEETTIRKVNQARQSGLFFSDELSRTVDVVYNYLTHFTFDDFLTIFDEFAGKHMITTGVQGVFFPKLVDGWLKSFLSQRR